MQIDRANIDNLTQLWQAYGARPLYEDAQLKLCRNVSWPSRVWADTSSPLSAKSLQKIANITAEDAIIPLWTRSSDDSGVASQGSIDSLLSQSPDWQLALQHTAMKLKLSKQQLPTSEADVREPLHFERLGLEGDVMSWAATGSRAFAYTIDENVISSLLAREDTQVLLAYNENSEPVATGLLFKTDDVVGIHQIGVPGEHQGKGYATQMMRFLIQCAEEWQADYAVLQASESGRPVYQKLGFVDQFLITYVQKSKTSK
jgi:GNAT superfamily N-acetyltransferase